MKPTPFHMVQLRLDTRGLLKFGRMMRLPLDKVDLGYLVHCVHGELFQEQSPKPFCVEGSDPERVTVLSYSSVGLEALEQLASGFASPTVYSICDWVQSASKPMPTAFALGSVLDFGVRLCPTVRIGAPLRDRQGKVEFRKGAELDVFLARALRDPEKPLERADVYHQWATERLEARGGLKVLGLETEHFALERFLRRTHGKERKSKPIKRPSVGLRGRLEVVEPSVFSAFLRQGVGRHKGFGFGMVKLRRASSRR